MKTYPAIRAKMGDWNYYIVRMKMRDVANEIKLADEIYDDETLSDAVQRILKKTRVKKQIVGYLSNRPDRFFGSIVVAALEGEPSWYPVEMDPRVVPPIIADDKTLRESFGILKFGDDPKYYALDGQHRVAAIRLLVRDEADYDAPPGFDDELLSVIVVLRDEHDISDREWLQRYRRLFSSLNRWVKKTDKDTDIIMDEDDLFAIVTRRLITDHEFFRAPGKERDSFRVQTQGKNLKRGSRHFTSLQTLYAVNETLLSTRARENKGWQVNGDKIDKQVRPDEQFIDDAYDEITAYWNAILDALPILRDEPVNRREHNPDLHSSDIGDHLGFWPIGQELLARIVRQLLDESFPQTGRGAHDAMVAALKPLTHISLDVHELPWRHLLLIQVPGKKEWRMRSDSERKAALLLAGRVLRWVANLDSLEQDGIDALHERWRELIRLDASSTDDPDSMWDKIIEIRGQVIENL